MVERLLYIGIIALVIVPYFWSSLIGIVLFAAAYGFRQMQKKKKIVALNA